MFVTSLTLLLCFPPLQNITTIRLPFLLLEVLGLGPFLSGFLSVPQYAAKYPLDDLMFITQPIQDALWGAEVRLPSCLGVTSSLLGRGVYFFQY